MSKKLNVSGGAANNTLFNYFAKSPQVEKKKLSTTQTPVDPKKEQEKENNVGNGNKAMKSSSKRPEPRKKLQMEVDNDDDDDEVVVASQVKRKRRLVIPDDDDSEDEEEQKQKKVKQSKSKGKARKVSDDDDEDFKPDKQDEQSDDDEDEDEEGDNDEEKHSSSSEDGSPLKRNNNNKPMSKKPRLDVPPTIKGSTFTEKLAQLQADTANSTKKKSSDDDKYEKIVCTTSTLDEPVVWPHQKLEFLMPANIKDKKGRSLDDPDYDRSTLQLPPKFLDGLSPGVRQWWVLKSDNFDCVLFFKVGKFYELYHMDADVGVNELGFTYMRGEFAHSGFPEVSFDKMASILVDRGYKVARVEQTETPDMMNVRLKKTKPTKFDKVVRREICQITNRGTQVFGPQCQITPNHQPNYMLALVEKSAGATSKYGVCYIDTSIGDFYVGEFQDDKNCSRLLTLLAHNMPVLVLWVKWSLSERSQQIFRTVLGGVLKESFVPTVCTAEKTLKLFAEQYYASSDNWPMCLRAMQAESDHLGLTPHDDYKLALTALGMCVTYMDKCHLQVKVLPMARYHLYTPPDEYADAASSEQMRTALAAMPARRSHMVLDATTLSNLRIIGEEHSLFATLDHCCTKFGKRLLHHWLCAPSCDVAVIVERQQAIGDLLANYEMLQEARALFAPMPDFERHLAQIHLFGNKEVSQNHPDGRAIFFEEKQYNKKKIQHFIGIIRGFEALMKIPLIFKECSSALLRRLTQLPGENEAGIFPDLHEHIEFFKNAFDHDEAAKTGVIAPEKGVDADYDEIEAKIAEINDELKQYLVEQEKYFGCRLSYFGTDKKRFQLEVPEKCASKAGKSYQLEGQKKTFRRFSTNETRSYLKQMQAAEDERNTVLRDLSRRVFEKFSKHYETWKRAVDCVSTLDVLTALAEFARQRNVICVPEIREAAGGQPSIELEDGYHPCVAAESYIPNGLVLGAGDTAPLSLLTGPNMGGKSTLMRQMGLLVVMAQIGAHVPAQSMRLSVVDRIFTRLGAQDDILSGHSTFLVELNETSLILKHATPSSLVLLDELGRGTSTYDGTAIAASVVSFLADLKCRTLFSTHYHNLIEFFHNDQRITLGHMACMVENEDTEDPTQETVTFLYKYSAGACPKSYGFNAAKLAGMPHPIIKRAYELSKRVEAIALQRKIEAKILTAAATDAGDCAPRIGPIKNLLLQLKMCQV